MDDEQGVTPAAATHGRPRTEANYGIPADRERLLPWTYVEETMAAQRSFWVTTTRPDGRPHARPTWGIWVDGRFHCGGSEGTRWVRNLAANPAITVHTEDAEAVVILEGNAQRLDEDTADETTLQRLDDAYEAKYDVRHGTPVFALVPESVLAWTDFPTDATRWQFEAD